MLGQQNRQTINTAFRSKYLQCFDAVGWWQEWHPACKKIEWWGAGMGICLGRGAGLHMAQPMPLPLTVSSFSKIHTGVTFLVPPHPRSLGHLDKESLNGCCYVVRGNFN